MTFRDLKLRVRALIAPRRVERELDEELAFHIERETQKHIANGLDPTDARTRAAARFGSGALAADQCRDARGTIFFDTLLKDILYAFRGFRRAPLAALTIVATVALGLGVVAVVFTFYSEWFLRVDAVRKPSELFEVLRPASPGANAWLRFTRPEHEMLRRETSAFTDAFAMLRGIGTRVDGRLASVTLVSGNFFHVLGVNAALGRTLTPADDRRFSGQPVIVLSHRGWSKLVASDPAAVGRSLRINGSQYEIVGVMPEGFRGLGIGPPDYWAPLSLVGQFRQASAGKEDEVAIVVVGRLKPGLSAEAATAGLTIWAAGKIEMETGNGSPATISLRSNQGTLSPDVLEELLIVGPLFFAFGLILMIGCANVANLLLARGVSRQREIGIRLSLGASRWRIIRQLLTESLLLALVSAACGFAVSRLILETAIYVAGSTMPPEVAEQVNLGVPDADWRVVAFLLGGALASTVFFGLAPALRATRLELVRTIRGELTRDARPGRARNALIAVQVCASALLLICAAVFLRGAVAATTVDTGVRTSDTVMVAIANEPSRTAILQAVRTDPSIAAVAASWPPALADPPDAIAEAATSAEATADKAAESVSELVVGYKFVSPEYFSVLDIGVLRGRSFTQAERTAGAGVVIVSESTARRLWPGRDAVGQVVHIEKAGGSPDAVQLQLRTFTVVGVVPDVRGAFRTAHSTQAAVYVPTSPENPGTSLTLRVYGDPERARQALIERLTRVDPAMGEIMTMRTMAGMEAYILRIAFWVAVVLGGLALVLTVSGLFSVLSYIVEQRRKEIGVRMALGATTRKVAGLVLSQLIRPVALGLVAGSALAAALAIVLTSAPVASQIQIGVMVNVFDSVAYTASLLCIATACASAALIPALRAARIDPIATLRQD